MSTTPHLPASLRTLPTTDIRQTESGARFWSKVDTTGDCWVWTAAKARFGHGLFWVSGRLQQAHRLAWVAAHGQIPDGLGVLHHCDTPSCVRPSHLFLGTQQDNVLDMLAKGRGQYQRKAA